MIILKIHWFLGQLFSGEFEIGGYIFEFEVHVFLCLSNI